MVSFTEIASRSSVRGNGPDVNGRVESLKKESVVKSLMAIFPNGKGGRVTSSSRMRKIRQET